MLLLALIMNIWLYVHISIIIKAKFQVAMRTPFLLGDGDERETQFAQHAIHH